jgi:hypothetical protein
LHFPVFTLKDGRSVRLTYEAEARADVAETAEAICAATSLPRLDVSWRDDANAVQAQGGEQGKSQTRIFTLI